MTNPPPLTDLHLMVDGPAASGRKETEVHFRNMTLLSPAHKMNQRPDGGGVHECFLLIF